MRNGVSLLHNFILVLDAERGELRHSIDLVVLLDGSQSRLELLAQLLNYLAIISFIFQEILGRVNVINNFKPLVFLQRCVFHHFLSAIQANIHLVVLNHFFSMRLRHELALIFKLA